MSYPANPASVRLQGLQALRSTLAAIRHENDFQTDLRWCDLVAQQDMDEGAPLPAIAITWQGTGVGMDVSCDCVRETLPVVLFAGVKGGPRRTERYPNDTQLLHLDQIVSDIRVAIGRDRSLGIPDIFRATVVSDELHPTSGERSVAWARIDLELEYGYPLSDPTELR